MQAATIMMEDSNDNNLQKLINAQPSSQAYSYDDLFPALPQNTVPQPLNKTTPKNMRVGSTLVTQVFHVPCEDRKSSESENFGEGESLRTCQQITKDTGASIEISSGKDHSLTFLVKGKPAEVADARRKIQIHFQTQASKQIPIPKEHHRVILGKKGERLRELEKSTGTKIIVPNINDESDSITISGTKEGIEKAEHEIRTMSDEQLKKSFERLIIPKIYHPFIVGPSNENLHKLMEEIGIKINVPPANANKDEISITGEKEGVLTAKARIEEIFRDVEKNTTTVSVEVPKSQHRYVFGQRGTSIQEILKLTGVSVEMPSADADTDTITLRGPQTALGNALNMVYQKANSVKTILLEVPSWIHKYIIGKKGANMKEFEQDYPNVNVNCLENRIKLEGPPEIVEKAKIYLSKTVCDYEQQYSFVVMTVNPNFYKHIIGKSGSNINRIKEDLKVMITIEEREGENNIRIEGPKEGVFKAQQHLQEKIDKLENEKTKNISIDHRIHYKIIGQKGETIREIKDKYRNVQITIPGQNNNNDDVKLRGPKDEVDKCYKDLMKLVKEIQESSYVVEVPIFKQFHKFVIGKDGMNIKKIRDQTQTKIDLPAEGDTNEVIVITGKKENVLDAKERIQKIQNELANIVTEEVQIPPKYYTSLIGSGGKLINSIMEECGGVSIKFQTAVSKNDKVTIRGPKDDVEKAKLQLMELINERQLTSFTAEVRAKQQHHKFLIGKNGSSIKKIRETTNTRIIFPSNDDTDREIITIIGKEENVKAAVEQLENMIKEIDNGDEIIIAPKYHKNFVAKRGELLHRISDECGGVMISFPRQGVDSDRVTLKGAKECIEAAKQRITEIIDDLDSQVTIEVVIPQKHHRPIMGSRGSKIQAITAEFNVQIKIPEKASTDDVVEGHINGNGDEILKNDIIQITGRLENCEAAKQALISNIPLTEELNVPFDLHRSIIGQKGSAVREFMRQYDVHIELSAQEVKEDIIKIKGTPSNVATAKTALLKRVEELEKDRKDRELRSFELKIEVDQQYHPKIIGRRGAVVNKIRNNHNVNISFPKRDIDNDNIITITGYESNAQAAKEEIMKMIDELNELKKEVVDIDQRIHPRLIGQRGRNIRKIMEEYKVDIKFPKPGDSNGNAITIIGAEENIESAKDHILNLEEEFLQDVTDSLPPQQDITQAIQQVFTTTGKQGKQGFILQGAPWDQSQSNDSAPNTQSQKDFPDFGSRSSSVNNTNESSTSMTSAWGQRR